MGRTAEEYRTDFEKYAEQDVHGRSIEQLVRLHYVSHPSLNRNAEFHRVFPEIVEEVNTEVTERGFKAVKKDILGQRREARK